jgi:superfamily II DNA or RNA helicase
MDLTKTLSHENEFPKGIKFKYDWRKYQQRVLDELEEHLTDNHLHIIAPPGSGKTILGLEVCIRLNKPTLILAPTTAIRNQWVLRFCELFLQTNQVPDWISTNIKEPQFLTVSTYQGLHAACTGYEEIEDDFEEENLTPQKGSVKITEEKTAFVIDALRSQNIGTIVIDEAHHLKNAWWKSLTAIKNGINPSVVGLTATPPYDVSRREWQRYIALNGPVDAEISVPELVKEKNLCPHQDLVFYSEPTHEENEKIKVSRDRINKVYNEILADTEFVEILKIHPIIVEPNSNLEWIYTNLEYYSATLIYLNSVGVKMEDKHLEVIGNRNFVVPEMDFKWMETLLSFYLYKDPENFSINELHQEKLINKLRRNGAIERRSISFEHHKKVNKVLNLSISKLDSIQKIVNFEYNQMGDSLRAVILTDYIRKEYLIEKDQNELELNKMGVLPIFEKLRRNNKKGIKIGVLTGSIVIIPKSSLSQFTAISLIHGISELSLQPLQFDEEYLLVKVNSKLKQNIVHIVTQVFEQGHMEVLIGTKSLLGEGWDAPAINTLILASFVGSYVLSNQMRGRAIRTDISNPKKTSNIWHLVCADANDKSGGDDVQLLNRRFKAFVGISFGEDLSIENGIARLGIPENINTSAQILIVNNKMQSHAGQRARLTENWDNALNKGVVLIEEMKKPFNEEREFSGLKTLYFNRTIKYVIGTLVSGVAGFSFEAIQLLSRIIQRTKSVENFPYWVMLIGILGVFFFGRHAYASLKMYLKYSDITKDIEQIGKALLASLSKAGVIHTNMIKLNVVTQEDESGAVFCSLDGGSTYEKSVFIKSLIEVLGAVDNPRYLIIRKGFLFNVIEQSDYHPVPDVIGKKKHFSEYFHQQWLKLVGSSELVYCRSIKGRKILLHSRINSLSSEFVDNTERVNKWR